MSDYQSRWAEYKVALTGTEIALLILLLLGKSLLILSLFYISAHFAFGSPCVLPLAFPFAGVGFVFLVAGARLAGGSWADSVTQTPHYCAAVASVPFLFVAIGRVIRHREIGLFPSGILTIPALVAFVTWWMRTRANSTSTSAGST